MSTTDTSMASVRLEGFQKARRRISDRIFYSPCPHSANISKFSGQDVFLKLENFQQTGSFKERGALNKLLTLTSAEKARGVIAASARNRAQGVAYHAQQLEIFAKIVIPTLSPRVKINATAGYGADVVLKGEGYDAATERPAVWLKRKAVF